MEAFKTLKGITVPLNMINVDTDQIIPKQFLKKIERFCSKLPTSNIFMKMVTAPGYSNSCNQL